MLLRSLTLYLSFSLSLCLYSISGGFVISSITFFFWFDSIWYNKNGTQHILFIFRKCLWLLIFFTCCCYWFWSYGFSDCNEQQLVFAFYKMAFRFIFDFVHWIHNQTKRKVDVDILSIFRWVFLKNTTYLLCTLIIDKLMIHIRILAIIILGHDMDGHN